MGEIVEMMLDGTMCEMCGEFLMNDDAPGHPMYCSVQCAKDRGIAKEDWPYLVEGFEVIPREVKTPKKRK